MLNEVKKCCFCGVANVQRVDIRKCILHGISQKWKNREKAKVLVSSNPRNDSFQGSFQFNLNLMK